MGLNVSAALLTSLLFVTGMSWAISQVNPPRQIAVSPLYMEGAIAAESDGVAVAEGASASGGLGRLMLDAPREREIRPAVELGQGPVGLEVSYTPRTPRLYAPPTYAPPQVVARANDAMSADEAEIEFLEIDDAAYATAPRHGPELLIAMTPAPVERAPLDPEPARDDARPEDAEPAVIEHRVARGDSLIAIIRRYWGRDDETALAYIVSVNPELAGRADTIRVGETLRIPSFEVAMAAFERSERTPARQTARESRSKRGAPQRSQPARRLTR